MKSTLLVIFVRSTNHNADIMCFTNLNELEIFLFFFRFEELSLGSFGFVVVAMFHGIQIIKH